MMVTIAIIGTFLFVLLSFYLLFFLTGGCVCLFRTALNNDLNARDKFRWMLAQTYFPPASIAYVALIEKNRTFKLLAAIGIITGAIFPMYSIVNGGQWSILPGKVAGYVEGIEKFEQTAEAKQKKHEDVKASHRQEIELGVKAKVLTARLNEINKTASADDAKNIGVVSQVLTSTSLAYATGALTEDDYAKLLTRLDILTANKTLSRKDGQEWVVYALRTIKDDNRVESKSHRNMAQTLAADPMHAAMDGTMTRLNAMYQAAKTPDDREKIRVVIAGISAMQGRHANHTISDDEFTNFLKDVDAKTAANTLSDADYGAFLTGLKVLVTKAPQEEQEVPHG